MSVIRTTYRGAFKRRARSYGFVVEVLPRARAYWRSHRVPRPMTEAMMMNIVLGQIALIAIMATLGLAWSLCEGYLEYRRRK